MTVPLYKCKYCKKPFPSEKVFMKHECTSMRRAQEIQTLTGSMAYGFYKRWLEFQRRGAPPIETFVTSAYYTGFLNFAAWVKATNVANPEKYVELMVQNKISPSLWRRTEAYEIYLEWHDKGSNPIEQATITVDTLVTLSEQLDCELKDVFGHFTAGQISDLIHQRKLSPWLLFCSTAFKEYAGKLHKVDKDMLMGSIGVSWWAVKLERLDIKTLTELRTLAKDLGI